MTSDSILETETFAGTRRARTGPDLPEPLLTVLGHPSASRVGDVCWLAALRSRGVIELNRVTPEFEDDDGQRHPLRTPFLSRKPLTLRQDPDGIVVIPGGLSGRVYVNGVALREPMTLRLDRLRAGVVLRLGTHVVLLLHVERRRSRPPRHLGMIGRSEALDVLRRNIERVAPSSTCVLIRGPSGVGKEHVAAALHRFGARPLGPYVTVNMAALAPTLAASELFGHVKGAFSGALSRRDGLFATAGGGTLFMDEVGDAPDEIQRALLRVLETGEIQRLGATRPRPVDVRVVTATDMDLETAIANKTFRQALYWRLAATELRVPGLVERRADIGRLLVHFLRDELTARGCTQLIEPDPRGKSVWLTGEVVERLALYNWPGHVRQLRNVARDLALTSADPNPLSPDDLRIMPESSAPTVQGLRPREVTDEQLETTLARVNYALGAAAKQLGISRPSLNELVDAHPNLKRAKFLTDEELDRGKALAEARGEPLWKLLKVSAYGLSRRLSRADTPG